MKLSKAQVTALEAVAAGECRFHLRRNGWKCANCQMRTISELKHNKIVVIGWAQVWTTGENIITAVLTTAGRQALEEARNG